MWKPNIRNLHAMHFQDFTAMIQHRTGTLPGLSTDLVQRLVGIISAFQGLQCLRKQFWDLPHHHHHHHNHHHNHKILGETKKISLSLMAYAAHVKLWKSHYFVAVITKGLTVTQASASLQAEGASNLYFLEI